MRSDTRARPATPVDSVAPADAGRDPTRAAALQRLAGALQPAADTVAASDARPMPDHVASPAPTEQFPVVAPPPDLSAATPLAPWATPGPDGDRPERVPPAEPDLSSWADPPWWRRIRWAPDRLAGIALVVLVVGLGAFSVHRLLSTVPEAAPVPQLPLATPGVTVGADDTASPTEPGASSAPGSGTSSTVPAAPEAGDGIVVVAVVGMVGRSGLVTLPAGSRVADALDHAGGVLDGGDRDGLNLARKVVDGEQILVGVAPGPDGPRGPRSDIVGPGSETPQAGGAPPAGEAGGQASGAPGPVNLNTADAAALDELPGVGPVTASAILSWRTANGSFASVDQLAEVDGIGPATLAKLRPLVTV